MLANVLGVASTTALLLVVSAISWGHHDPRGHLTGEAKGWVQAGLSSELGGHNRPKRIQLLLGPQQLGGPSWLLLVMMGQLSVAPSSGAEACGAKTQSQIGKILLLGWTRSTNKSMIKLLKRKIQKGRLLSPIGASSEQGLSTE